MLLLPTAPKNLSIHILQGPMTLMTQCHQTSHLSLNPPLEVAFSDLGTRENWVCWRGNHRHHFEFSGRTAGQKCHQGEQRDKNVIVSGVEENTERCMESRQLQLLNNSSSQITPVNIILLWISVYDTSWKEKQQPLRLIPDVKSLQSKHVERWGREEMGKGERKDL